MVYIPLSFLILFYMYACLQSVMKIIYPWIRLPEVECYFLMMDPQTIFETSRIHSTITRVII